MRAEIRYTANAYGNSENAPSYSFSAMPGWPRAGDFSLLFYFDDEAKGMGVPTPGAVRSITLELPSKVLLEIASALLKSALTRQRITVPIQESDEAPTPSEKDPAGRSQ